MLSKVILVNLVNPYTAEVQIYNNLVPVCTHSDLPSKKLVLSISLSKAS